MSLQKLLLSCAVVLSLAACGGGGGRDSVPTAKTLNQDNAGPIAQSVVEILLTPIVPLTEGSVVAIPSQTEDSAAAPVAREILSETACSGGGNFVVELDDDTQTLVTLRFAECIEDTSTIDGELEVIQSGTPEAFDYAFAFNNLRVADSGETSGGAELDLSLNGTDIGRYEMEENREILTGVTNMTLAFDQGAKTGTFTLTNLQHVLEVEALAQGVQLTQNASGVVTVPGGTFQITTQRALVSQDDLLGEIRLIDGFIQITAQTGESMFVQVMGDGMLEMLISYPDGEELSLVYATE